MQSPLVRLHLVQRLRALAPVSALWALFAFALSSSGCSLDQCQQMKSNGSAFAGVLCGGSGDDAPEAADGGPTACSDISQVMPQFFELLDAGQLTGIQEAVQQIGQPTCADEPPPAACNSDTVCPIGVCDPTTNHCPCQNAYSPLGDLLESTFHALAIISNPSNPGEPGAVPPSKCVDAAAAEALPPGQRNTLCEIRRTLDFLVNQDGGDKLFNDPNVNAVLVALLNYIQGDYTPPAGTTATPHYDLFTTFGLMAQNPGVCDPQITYDLLDKALVYLTPTVGTRFIGDANALLNDPTTVGLLAELGGGAGTDPAARRQAVVTILLDLLPSIENAPDGATAMSPIENLLVNVLHLYAADSTYPAAFQNEVRTLLVDLGCADPQNTGTCSVPDDPVMGAGLLGPLPSGAGIFPDITTASQQSGLLWCLSNANVDPTGNLIGALYDLITLQSTAAGGAINLGTLLGAVQELLALDPTGQTNRSLQIIVEGIASDPTVVEALRELLAQALTPAVGQELIPPLSAIIQHQVVGEILSLLQDILYSCNPPPASSSGN